jgi:hypothetical protein
MVQIHLGTGSGGLMGKVALVLALTVLLVCMLAFAPFFLLPLQQTISELSLFARHHGPAAAPRCRRR